MVQMKQMSIDEISEYLGISYAATRQHIYKHKWHKYKDNHKNLKISVPLNQLNELRERLGRKSKRISPEPSLKNSMNSSVKVKDGEQINSLTTSVNSLVKIQSKLQEVQELLLEKQEDNAQLRKEYDKLDKTCSLLKLQHQQEKDRWNVAKECLEHENKKFSASLVELEEDKVKLQKKLRWANRSWWRKLISAPPKPDGDS